MRLMFLPGAPSRYAFLIFLVHIPSPHCMHARVFIIIVSLVSPSSWAGEFNMVTTRDSQLLLLERSVKSRSISKGVQVRLKITSDVRTRESVKTKPWKSN